MSVQLATCQCPKPSDHGCSRVATQEDLLCDICRPGCATLTINPFQGAPGRHSAHIEIVKMDFKVKL